MYGKYVYTFIFITKKGIFVDLHFYYLLSTNLQEVAPDFHNPSRVHLQFMCSSHNLRSPSSHCPVELIRFFWLALRMLLTNNRGRSQAKMLLQLKLSNDSGVKVARKVRTPGGRLLEG